MKYFIIFLMISQAFLFFLGVYDLIQGKTEIGLFNVIVNSICFCINILNLERCNDTYL